MHKKVLIFDHLCNTVVTLSLLASCISVTLISKYDDLTDKYLTNLQQTTSKFIDTLEQLSGTEAASFEKQRQKYDALNDQIKQLEFRVAAVPKNDKTIAIVKNIRLSILGNDSASKDRSSLKDIHCVNDTNIKTGPPKEILEICRRNIDQTISQALALELAKKQLKD